MPALQPPACDFGWRAPPFSLLSVDGKTYDLESVRGTAGTVIMFICNHCPYVQTAIDRIITDMKALQAADIGVAAIMSNDTDAYPQDGFEPMKAFAASNGFTFPYLLDETQEVARAYDAVCTPDFFGFDKDLGLQYRGRLDAGTPGRIDPDAPRELHDAMRQVAQTGQGPQDQMASIGCSIKWRG
ncbi:MAG: thioredoxin family protein [Pseudomonadota bacterium]